jgi:hypothetical protein
VCSGFERSECLRTWCPVIRGPWDVVSVLPSLDDKSLDLRLLRKTRRLQPLWQIVDSLNCRVSQRIIGGAVGATHLRDGRGHQSV